MTDHKKGVKNHIGQNGIFLLDAFKMASDGKPGYDSRFSPDTLTKLALKVP